MRALNAKRIERWLLAHLREWADDLVIGGEGGRAEVEPLAAEEQPGDAATPLLVTFPGGEQFLLGIRAWPPSTEGFSRCQDCGQSYVCTEPDVPLCDECLSKAERAAFGNYQGVQLPSGAIFHVSPDASPETLKALDALALRAEMRVAGWQRWSVGGFGVEKLDLSYRNVSAYLTPARIAEDGTPITWAGFVDMLDGEGKRSRLVFTERNNYSSRDEVRAELERMVLSVLSGREPHDNEARS